MSRPGLGQKRSFLTASADGDDHTAAGEAGNDPNQTEEEEQGFSSKRLKTAAPDSGQLEYDERQRRLMAAAGYKGYGGLGRSEQGRLRPVEASTQIARRGHGFKVSQARHEFEEQRITIEIPVTWLPLSAPAAEAPLPELSEMDGWLRTTPHPRDDGLESVRRGLRLPSSASGSGVKQEDDPPSDDLRARQAFLELLEDFQEQRAEVQKAKSRLDDIDRDSLVKARQRSNPFELIRSALFCNRAAVKMAEMDRICDRLFTRPPAFHPGYQPPKHTPEQQLQPRKLLYFADICAGPGGFSEYILTVLKWRAKGFGFTLAGKMDFIPDKFNTNAPAHTFRAYYGEDGTGDITKTLNMKKFAADVDEETRGYGVHLVMADGGFDFTDQQDNQEVVVQQLILCQIALGMAVLAEDGVFVLKVFDAFLPLSVELLYLIRLHFREFAILKPNQSRPANSERYIVGKGFRQRKPEVVEYLYRVNDLMNELEQRSVPLSKEAAILKKAPQWVQGGKVGGGAEAERDGEAGGVKKEEKSDDPAMAVAAAVAGNGDGGVKKEKTAEGGMKLDGIKSEATAGVKMETSNAAAEDGDDDDDEDEDVYKDRSSAVRVIGVVDPKLISQDPSFMDYLGDSNARIAGQQIAALERLVKYVEDETLPMDDQETIRDRCLKYWGIPGQATADSVAGGLGGGDDGTFGFSSDDKGALQRQLQIKEEARRKRIKALERARQEGMYIVHDPDYGQVLFSPEPQRVFQDYGPGEKLYNEKIRLQMRGFLPFLRMPTKQEWEAGKSRRPPIPLTFLQLHHMGKVLDWFVYPIPAGGQRFTLMAGPRCCFLATDKGLRMIDSIKLPPDTILDVVLVNTELYVLDIWCVPTELDLYERRKKMDDRHQFMSMFVEAVRQPVLRYRRPMSLRRLLQDSPYLRVTPQHGPLTEEESRTDLYFILGNAGKPWPSQHRVWRADPEDYTNDRPLLQELLPKEVFQQIPPTPATRADVRNVVKYLLDQDFHNRQKRK